MIWAVVLAAGESKRMRNPKMLLPFGDLTIVETVIKRCVESNLDSVLVVAGAHKERVIKKIERYPVKICINDNYQKGMLSSVQRGFQCLPEEAHAAAVMLGDQPLIPITVINSVIEAFERTEKGMALPVYEQKRGHPLIIDRKYQNAVDELNPEVGLRELLRKYPFDIEEVEVSDPNILKDIDTPEDYTRSS
jgi:molybdenum cofactor cytidylyltransferase